MPEMQTSMSIKSYSELASLKTFEERFEYLRCDNDVGSPTFGGRRYLNQILYNSKEWRSLRDSIFIRDNGFDLGIEDRPIKYGILVHHINPITIDDILERRPSIFDPENLITTCARTHNAIHYGDASLLYTEPIERRPYDTCPWR